jgi:hypothetical protein
VRGPGVDPVELMSDHPVWAVLGRFCLLRVRHRSELLHQSEGIEDRVLLDDLAVAYANESLSARRHRLARRRDAHELTFSFASRASRRHARLPGKR